MHALTQQRPYAELKLRVDHVFIVCLITLIYYIIKTTHLYATFLYSIRGRNNFGPSILMREGVSSSLDSGGCGGRVPARPWQAPVHLK